MYPATTAMQNALADPVKQLGFLLEFNLDPVGSGTQRLCTFGDDKTWNAQTWTAVAGFQMIGSFREAVDELMGPLEITITTSDVLVSNVFRTESKGRLFRWWRAAIGAGGAIIADPRQRPTLRMTPGRLYSGVDAKSVTIIMEDMFTQHRARVARTRSHADQKRLFAPPLGEDNDECLFDVSRSIVGGVNRPRLVFRGNF